MIAPVFWFPKPSFPFSARENKENRGSDKNGHLSYTLDVCKTKKNSQILLLQEDPRKRSLGLLNNYNKVDNVQTPLGMQARGSSSKDEHKPCRLSHLLKRIINIDDM